MSGKGNYDPDFIPYGTKFMFLYDMMVELHNSKMLENETELLKIERTKEEEEELFLKLRPKRSEVLEYLKDRNHEELEELLFGKPEAERYKDCIWYITSQTMKYVCFENERTGSNHSKERYFDQFLGMLKTLEIPEDYFAKVCADGQKRIFFNAMSYPSDVKLAERKWTKEYHSGEDLFEQYQKMMKKWNKTQKNTEFKFLFSDVVVMETLLAKLLCPYKMEGVDIHVKNFEDLPLKDEVTYREQVELIKKAVVKHFYDRYQEQGHEVDGLKDFISAAAKGYDKRWADIETALVKVAGNKDQRNLLLEGLASLEDFYSLYVEHTIRGLLTEYKAHEQSLEMQTEGDRWCSYKKIWNDQFLLSAKYFYDIYLAGLAVDHEPAGIRRGIHLDALDAVDRMIKLSEETE